MERYMGEWQDGMFNGLGSYVFADGSYYFGGFRDDQKFGFGTLVKAPKPGMRKKRNLHKRDDWSVVTCVDDGFHDVKPIVEHIGKRREEDVSPTKTISKEYDNIIKNKSMFSNN